MSQDEDEEDDDDHESESSQSHFEGEGDGDNENDDEGMEVEDEEDEDDEDDDDDEDEDDESGNPFGGLGDQFGQELDDAIYRFPLGPGDTGDDDMEMMIQQYVDEPGLHNHMDPHERMRAIQLPLWSDMVHGLGGLGVSDPVNAGGASS